MATFEIDNNLSGNFRYGVLLKIDRLGIALLALESSETLPEARDALEEM